MVLFEIISSIRSWLLIIFSPYKSLRDIIECQSLYIDANSKLELLDSGVKLILDMIFPVLLLGLVGSLMPTPALNESIESIESSSLNVDSLIVSSFSPYTFALSLSTTEPNSHHVSPNPDLLYFTRLCILSMISPVFAELMIKNFLPVLSQTAFQVIAILLSRKSPNNATKAAFAHKVKTGRIIRRHRYDLYLPPPSEFRATRKRMAWKTAAPSSKNDTEKESLSTTISLTPPPERHIPALIFYPGFSVQHSSYADVASRISDCGIPVAVVSLEPLRLANKFFGCGVEDVRHLIEQAGREVVQHYQDKERELDGSMQEKEQNSFTSREEETLVVEWAVGGHSMGGYAALQLGGDMLERNDYPSITFVDGSISRMSNQIVAWAAGSFVQSVPNLRPPETSPLKSLLLPSNNKSKPLRVLILLASNDPINKFSSAEQRSNLLSKLPKKSTVLYTIDGANHSGFGSYRSGFIKPAIKDGVRGIPLEVQHVEACSQTVHFLLER